MDVKDAATDAVLARELRLDAAGMEQRKRLVGLEKADLELIRQAKPAIEAHLDRLADSFFEFLRPMPEAQSLLGRPDLYAEARRLKREHLQAMAAGEYDVPYATQRAKLGTLYGQVLLDPRLFLGAFHHLLRAMGKQIMAALDPAQAFEAFMSLNKVGFLDIGIIVDVLIAQRERLIVQQQDSIRELSTPVLQIRDQLLLLPIIGVVDTLRARMMTETLLRAIRSKRAKMVVMDVTGVATIDSRVANHLLQTITAARLMGARVIVTGLSAEVAQSLAQIGVDLTGITTAGDLQGGIEDAEQLLGLQVVREKDRSSAA